MSEALLELDPTRAALLVVDVQNDFCHDKGALAQRGADMAPAQTMARNVAPLIEAARTASIAVVYTLNAHDRWTDAPSWAKRHASKGSALARAGSWGAELYGLAPRADERLLYKHRYNAFVGTDLDLILRSRGLDTLVFTGVATNICVESTARDAYVRNYRVVMVEDCLAGSSPAEHDWALRSLARYFDATVVRSEVLLRAWSRARGLADVVDG